MNALMIAGTSIKQDADGRYCLNDLHRAAGGAARHKPSEWLRNTQTAELVEELEAGNPASRSVNTIKGHGVTGTYACKELVYSYAMWISPKFHLQVIRTFDAVVNQQPIVQGAIAELQLSRVEFVNVVGDVFEGNIRLAHQLGFTGNQALLYADGAVKRQIGVSVMDLLGVTSLPASSNEDMPAYLPTQLGKRFGTSGQAFNKLLAVAGLQAPVPKGQGQLRWEPTAKGKPHSKICDTRKQHNGAAVQELRWHESVLDELRKAGKELGLLIAPVSRG